MFKKPEDVQMTQEESELYGKKVDAENAQYEHVEYETSGEPKQKQPQSAPRLTEEEIKKRVGEQNFENATDSDIAGSINS